MNFGDLHLDAIGVAKDVPSGERQAVRAELLRIAGELPDEDDRRNVLLVSSVALAALMCGTDPYLDVAAFAASEYDGRAIEATRG